MSFQCYIILKLSNTVISIVEKLMKRTASVRYKVPTKGRQTKLQYAYFPLSLDLELYSMFLLNVQFVSQSEKSKKNRGQ